MADEIDIDTDRLQDTIEEKRRDAADESSSVGERQNTAEKGREKRRPRWLDYLAISTALFAVFAAFAALQAGDAANEALLQANKAVLQQTQAVDTWSQYQAESIKKYEQRSLAVILAHTNGSAQEIKAANDEAAKRQSQEGQLQAEAQKRDTETAALSKESQDHMEHHRRFALSVTLFQVAIGLAAIAALLQQRPIWYVSLAAGALAFVALADGFSLTI